MKRIIEFFKEKYKILIPLMVVMVLLVTIFFLYREYKFDNTRKKLEYQVNQYFGGLKSDYTLVITYNLNNQIIGIAPKTKRVEYDSTPIYFKDEDKILFPEVMSIIFPLDRTQYKLYSYSIYERKSDNHYISNNKNNDKYTNFFLYDGEGLYFFPTEVNLYIGENEYTKLLGMSYISIDDGYNLVYYDKVSDKAESINIEGKNISVRSNTINVDLSNKSFKSFSSDILLFSPDNLNTLYKIN